MPGLRPFFTFYGGKWRVAPLYPTPLYPTIVEPFAGAAGCSVRYPDRQVVLVERDAAVAATWRYLLRASPGEILALPDVPLDGTVDDLDVPPGARCLIGFWLNGGSSMPKKRPGAWMRRSPEHGGEGWATGGGQLSWGPRVRERLAAQVDRIRHWRPIEGDYREAPDVEATWFIDPPYQVAGRHYRHHDVDYPELGEWCRTRKGQVIVCEQEGADWLPFRPWRRIKASEARHGGKVSREATWIREDPRRRFVADVREACRVGTWP